MKQVQMGHLSGTFKAFDVASLGFCMACRAHVVGALLGPLHGDKTFPGDWLKKAVKYTDVKQMVHVVIVQRKTLVPFHINRDPAQQPQPE